jgi:hypothetical protein
MLRFDAPEEFVDLLKRLQREMEPEKVINTLKWSSENPADAKRLAERYDKLGYYGRREFETSILCGNNPDYAMESAEKYQAEVRECRSLLGKVIAGAKKGGYKLALPNGVECIARRSEDYYEFDFFSGGAKVTLVRRWRRRGCNFKYLLEGIMKGSINAYMIDTIFYNGKGYHPTSKIACILIEAIQQNTRPEIAAAVGETE